MPRITSKEPAERVEEHIVKFIANQKQRAFIVSKAKSALFASRLGEGKTAGLCWACFHHQRQHEGSRWAIIRDTWENNRDTTQKEFFYWFPPGEMGHYVSSEKTFYWTIEGMVGCEVVFLGMDEPRDASKLMSRALAGFAMDEPAPATTSVGISEHVFDIAIGRLRQKHPRLDKTYDRVGGYYTSKLAENNPDEDHWTYDKFVEPGQPDFVYFQPREPENTQNLPSSYYEELRARWVHRPDLVRRFVEGRFGFQQEGKGVTPQFNEEVHLTHDLVPIPGFANYPLVLLWDFGLTPCCVITQPVPSGHWNILECFQGIDMGIEELIDDFVQPALKTRYRRMEWWHIADPAGVARDPTTIRNSPYRSIRKKLGGHIRPGPVSPDVGVDALGATLSRLHDGTGLIRIDKKKARPVWYALRGGWHYKVNAGGVVSKKIVKDKHSHPGDCMRYGAAVLYPRGDTSQKKKVKVPQTARFFKRGEQKIKIGRLGFERPGMSIPRTLKAG